MALVLRGARAVGILTRAANAPAAAEVRPPPPRAAPLPPPNPNVSLNAHTPPAPPDARLTAPRPAPLLRPQVAGVRRFGVTAAGRAGMGSPVPAHEPPTAPVRSAAPTPRRSIRARKETLRS